MKRFTLLTMLVALLSVTAFAQKGLRLLPMKDALQTSSVKMKVISKEESATPEVVVAPENLTVEDYTLTYTDYYGKPSSGVVKIGFDGNDVYVQGFNSYLPEAWIKGVLADGVVTFAGDQYYGSYGENEMGT